jgi:hypothetical protein
MYRIGCVSWLAPHRASAAQGRQQRTEGLRSIITRHAPACDLHQAKRSTAFGFIFFGNWLSVGGAGLFRGTSTRGDTKSSLDPCPYVCMIARCMQCLSFCCCYFLRHIVQPPSTSLRLPVCSGNASSTPAAMLANIGRRYVEVPALPQPRLGLPVRLTQAA